MKSEFKRQLNRMLTMVSVAFASACMVFGFQNCGQFVVDGQKIAQLASLGPTESAGAVLVPATDKIDGTCRINPAYDACLIRQNPLNGGAITALSANADVRRSQLSSEAFYGVKLTSLSGNGKLENATISIQSRSLPAVATTPAALKSLPATVGSSNFEQVNTYYWMNRTAEYFDARTNGALPAKGKGITVVVDDTITGYETSTKTIRLKSTEAMGAVAWSGDLAVHMFGIANLMLANPSGWTSLSATKHLTCAAVDKGCCTAATGCANAIRFGVGEYFAASMFPEQTRIGAALVTTGNPQIIAGIQRDVAALGTITAVNFFSTSSGYTQAMGLLYASIWWQIRAAARDQSAEIDRIFVEHLVLLDGTDDFKTAIAKAKTIDARLFGGRHAAQFDAQLAARGI